MTTLQELLEKKIDGYSPITGEEIVFSPDFRASIQRISGEGVHFIIHADGYNSETLDFVVKDNKLTQLD